MRVTGPPDSPEQLAALERQIWRKQLRASLIFLAIILGLMVAVLPVLQQCRHNLRCYGAIVGGLMHWVGH